MADAGTDLGQHVLGQLLEFRVEGGFQRGAGLDRDSWNRTRRGSVGRPALISSAVRPRRLGADHDAVGAAQLGVVLLLEPAGARGVAGFQRPARLFDLFGAGLGGCAEHGPGEGAGGSERQRVRDGPAAGNRCDLLVGDGPGRRRAG